MTKRGILLGVLIVLLVLIAVCSKEYADLVVSEEASKDKNEGISL